MRKTALATVLVGIGIVIGVLVTPSSLKRSETESDRWESVPAESHLLSDRASTITVARLWQAFVAVKSDATLESLPFGTHPFSDFPWGRRSPELRERGDLVDEWGNEICVRKTLQGVFVISAGRDKTLDTGDDAAIVVDLSEFEKSLDNEDDLSSLAVQQRVIDAFHKTVGNQTGYHISVTENGRVEVTLCPD